MNYIRLYGKNIKERARRLAENITLGKLPPVKSYTMSGLFPVHFTDKYRYVENLYQLSPDEMKKRNFIVVRSQKYNIKRKTYKVKTKGSVYDTFYSPGIDLQGCTCCYYRRTQSRCKHMLAVKLKYKNSDLKKLIF